MVHRLHTDSLPGSGRNCRKEAATNSSGESCPSPSCQVLQWVPQRGLVMYCMQNRASCRGSVPKVVGSHGASGANQRPPLNQGQLSMRGRSLGVVFWGLPRRLWEVCRRCGQGPKKRPSYSRSPCTTPEAPSGCLLDVYSMDDQN